MSQTPRKAGIYRRISDDREGREAGVERQGDDCRALATQRNLTVVTVYTDDDIGASTRSRKRRPDYEQMIEDARAGRFDVILAYSSSRITRRPRENEDLIELAERHGIEFAYVRSPSFDLNSADGRHVARMLAANDAAEAERTGERVQRAFRQKEAAGEWRGGPRPFGFDEDGVTERVEEAELVKRASLDVIAGTSLATIAAQWNRLEVVTPRGLRFTPIAVRQVLARARNAGLIELGGNIVGPALWDGIVSEEEWRAVRAVFADPRRRKTPGPEPRWLGSGLYVCGPCGGGMLSQRNHDHRRIYRCRHAVDKTGRRHTSRVADPVDTVVEVLLVARLSRPDAVDLVPVPTGVDTSALRAERARIEVLLTELDDDRDAGRVTRARWLRRNEDLTGRLARVDAELGAVERVSPLAGLPLGAPEAMERTWFGTLPDRSDGLDVSRRRGVLRELVTVTVVPKGKGWRPIQPPSSLDDVGITVDWL